MFKKWFIGFFLLLIGITNVFGNKPALIKGVFKNFNKDSLEIQVQPYALLSTSSKIKIPVGEDGSFAFSIPLDGPVKAFAILSVTPVEEKFTVPLDPSGQREVSTKTNRSDIVYMYLQPGDDLWVEADAQNVHHNLQMKGSAAGSSLYLMADDQLFNTYKDRHLKNYFGYVNYGPDFYRNEVEKRKNARMSLLDLHVAQQNMHAHLIQWSKLQIEADAWQALLHYPTQRATYTQQAYTPPADYFDFMAQIRLEESMQTSGIGYVYFVDQYLKSLHRLQAPEEDYAAFVKNRLEGALLYEYAAWSLGSKIDNGFLALFEKSNPYKALSKEVKRKYNPKALLKLRKQALQAVLEAPDGSIFRLQDLKGQLVYIDFWATWCVPCIEEIPHLEHLQELLKGENLVFVSISIDKADDKGKWLQFVKEKALKGKQAWAGTKSASTFKKALMMQSIPRFVLIDEKGNFLDVQAPRPSEPSTEKWLRSNLK
jgi:thiol-disulfide isomerase/thioredoxin